MRSIADFLPRYFSLRTSTIFWSCVHESSVYRPLLMIFAGSVHFGPPLSTDFLLIGKVVQRERITGQYGVTPTRVILSVRSSVAVTWTLFGSVVFLVL